MGLEQALLDNFIQQFHLVYRLPTQPWNRAYERQDLWLRSYARDYR
jgi:hypothetical protein